MKKTIHSSLTGHTLHISSINRADLPEVFQGNNIVDMFTTFYAVRNWDEKGHIFFYLAKGHKNGPTQVCGFYTKGAFWARYGKNLQEAVEGMQRDGWMAA